MIDFFTRLREDVIRATPEQLLDLDFGTLHTARMHMGIADVRPLPVTHGLHLTQAQSTSSLIPRVSALAEEDATEEPLTGREHDNALPDDPHDHILQPPAGTSEKSGSEEDDDELDDDADDSDDGSDNDSEADIGEKLGSKSNRETCAPLIPSQWSLNVLRALYPPTTEARTKLLPLCFPPPLVPSMPGKLPRRRRIYSSAFHRRRMTRRASWKTTDRSRMRRPSTCSWRLSILARSSSR